MFEIKKYHPLKSLNTFGVEATAKYFAELTCRDEILEFINNPEYQHLPKLILNGGSNILFTGDFDGVVMKLNTGHMKVVKEDNDNVWVEAGAGVKWDDLVNFCADNDWAGLENLSMIPGNVGAAPVQNIGAYGVEQKDCFCRLQAVELATGKELEFSKHACLFGYRNSIFKHELKGKMLILSVTYRLSKNSKFNTQYGTIKQELEKMDVRHITVKSIGEAVRRIRRAKLPMPEEVGNAGSFFKNPVVDKHKYYMLSNDHPGLVAHPVDKTHYKISAAWLIDSLGWKGKQRGDAGVWHAHALVLVNYGNATGKQIINLADDIRRSVFNAYGIELEPEVVIV